MPSHNKKTIRTYEKRTRSQQATNSVEAVNALFAENLKRRLIGKRKKTKLKIKDLPDRGTVYLTDESLVTPQFEDTFDRLRRGTTLNKAVQTEKPPSRVISSDNDFSILNKTSVYSEKSNSKVSFSNFSPILTRSRTKQPSTTTDSSTNPKSAEDVGQSKTNSLDKLPSLCFDDDNKKSYHFKYSSLSYIKIPNMRECQVFLDTRCDKIFSESFVERNTVVCSTPVLKEPLKQKIVAYRISPIRKLLDLKPDDLTEKSYEEIRKWDSKFPNDKESFDNTFSSIRRRSKRKQLALTISSNISNKLQDSQLQNLPRVWITLDDTAFKGFSEAEQNRCQATSEDLKDYVYKQSKMIAKDERLLNRKINIERRRINGTLSKAAKKSILYSPTKVTCTNSLLNEFELFSRNGSVKSHETMGKSIVVNLTDFETFEAQQSVILISDDSITGTTINDTVDQPTSDVGNTHHASILHDHLYYSAASNTEENEDESKAATDSDDSASNCSECSECNIQQTEKVLVEPIILKPGKKYRRSLNLIRKTMTLVQVKEVEEHAENCSCWKCAIRRRTTPSRRSMSMVTIAEENFSVLGNYVRKSLGYVQEVSKENSSFEEEELDDCVRNLSLNLSTLDQTNFILSPPSSPRLLPPEPPSARDIVLRRCGQIEPIPFEECYPPSLLQNCRKIGEGVYGEVFLYRDPNGGTSVMKIMPIEGDLIVNGEHQKKFDEILSEIVIAMELSNLKNCEENRTTTFNEVKRVRCTQGSYPERLLDLWNLYEENGGSENDSPEMFQNNQLFIILELSNGGQDLESFVFSNAQQAYSMLQQTACALAVAESQLKFEHRDLHWGNILIQSVRPTTKHHYYINGDEFTVHSKGIEVTMIDFTLSRAEFEDVVIFNDLSLDNELFAATGDYQFDIYRLMKKATGNKWQDYEPYTNILWLHYLLDKVSHFRYQNTRLKIHKDFLKKLVELKDHILSYRSVTEFVKHNFV